MSVDYYHAMERAITKYLEHRGMLDTESPKLADLICRIVEDKAAEIIKVTNAED